ncbi:MAG: hypothetical protein ACI9QL_000320 [Candidatus Omnitrophota bacterium]|jgi:hypothetical protein
MKQKLKYIFPLLAIFVLLWGLLTLAEKMALLISITILTGFILFQFRQDRRRPRLTRPAIGPNHIEAATAPSRQEVATEKARSALTQLLRQALQIPTGRFKQDVEAFNIDADRLVAALEARPESHRELKDLPEWLTQAKQLLREFPPASQERKLDIQREIQQLHEQLKAISPPAGS